MTHALENINCDIIGLSEVRRLGCGIEEYKDYILCYIGQTKGLYGVGFLIKKTLKSNITNFIGITERVALLQLKFDEVCMSIIQTYAPTENSSEEEVTTFYNNITMAHEMTNNGIVLVIGDFNAKIGQPQIEENLIMGKYGYGKRNERGERLIDYAREYKLAVMNTFFKKRANQRWTWISPDHKVKNEIDFILTNNPKVINNIEVLNNVNFPSDHRLVRATCLIKLPKKSRKNFKDTPKNLKSEKEIQNYLYNLGCNISNNTDEHTGVQENYNMIEEVIKNSLKTASKSDKRIRQKIISETTEKLIEKRTKLLTTKNKDKYMRSELSKLFKEVKRAIKKDYSKHRHDVITRNLNNFRSTKRALRELNLSKTWIHKLEYNFTETKTRKDILNFTTAFYKELYKKKQNDIHQIINSKSISNTVEPIDEKEVYKHITSLKTEKSPGPDGLSNEALRHGLPILLNPITNLFNKILDTEMVPKQWCTSDIILLYKKGNPLDVGNYRPISLLSCIYKIFSSILSQRIAQKIDNAQTIEQAGFRSGFSTIDHIHTLGQVTSKYKEFNKPLYVAFIDYSKAFDSINHNAIWNALQLSKIDQKYINIIKFIYANSTSKVKLETRGEEVKIERGVRQGDPISPKLFIAVLENIFKNLNWHHKGIEMDGRYLSHLQFADDIVLLTEKPEELQEMICSLDQESHKIGLEMNINKTRIMTNSYEKPIKLNGKPLEYVQKYIYLGKQISFSNSNEEEIERRINITWKKFWSLKEILKGDYSVNLKRIVIDTCLLPCLLYGSQTWIYTNKTKHKIQTTQRAIERSILNIKKIHKVRSDFIRQKTKVTDALTHALKLKWKWAGHISRLTDSRWTIHTTKWKGPKGKRKVGRPYRRWTDDIIQVAGKDWITKGKERESWKKMEEAFARKGFISPNLS